MAQQGYHVLHALSPAQRDDLVAAIRAADPEARIWLHGSRVRDDARGGDIDVLVVSERIGLAQKLDVLTRLHRAWGEQRVDLTVVRDADRPFAQLAIEQGVAL